MMQDLAYIRRGYQIIMVIDPHELIDYCFPINPTQRARHPNLEEVGESQAGLSYLFQFQGERPFVVLIPDYLEELKEVIEGMKKHSPRMYDTVETIEEIIRFGDLEKIPQQKQIEMGAIVENSFQFLLSVMLGIHSIGVNRIKDVLDHVLLKSVADAVHIDDRAHIQHIWDQYRPRNYDTILRLLDPENRSVDPRMRKKNERDAKAIDRLIYMNEAVARDVDLLKQGYVFLYVSSAPKSERIFARPQVRSVLPRIKGRRRFNFLRNRRQVLAYVVYHSRSNKPLSERVVETCAELKKLHRLTCRLDELKEVIDSPTNDCHECILDGKRPTNCKYENECLEIDVHANLINGHKNAIINWGLYRDITSYKNLLDNDASHQPFQVYMELFRELLHDKKLRDHALDRMHERHVWITRASDWMLSRHSDPELTTREDMRSELDPVRGTVQYLPIQPYFDTPEYKEVIDLIVEFFKRPSKKDLVEQIYKKFHDLNPAEADEEYVLLRCYIYLIFRYEGKRLHEDIKKRLADFVERRQGKSYRESLYLLCWSARRFGSFEESEKYAKEGIDNFPDEPRFHHGWSLTVFAGMQNNIPSPHTFEEAAAASERALNLYPRSNTDQVAACHNNIAYMLAYDVKYGENTDSDRYQKLDSARQHLDALENVLQKSDWDPEHPEYFHTSAFLKFQEAFQFFVRLDVLELKEKLVSAKADIRIASDILDCPKYQNLKREINDFYQRFIPEHLK